MIGPIKRHEIATRLLADLNNLIEREVGPGIDLYDDAYQILEEMEGML